MGNESSSNTVELGLRILRVKKDSPGDLAGILPFEDFIVGVVGYDPNFQLIRDFSTYVTQQENKEIEIVILNCFSGDMRKIKLLPHRSWPSADSLLGLKIRPERIASAFDGVAKITKVVEESPSSGLGIIEERDFLVGAVQFDFDSIEQFSEKLQQYVKLEADPTLDLYLVDIGTLQGRYVKIKPTTLWKGTGLLGLEFGCGVFDARLITELLEKRAKRSNNTVLTIDGIMNEGNSQANPSQHPNQPVITYYQTKTEKAEEYTISSNDILPAMSFSLREYVYHV